MGIFYRIAGKDVQPSYLLGTKHNFPYDTILQKINFNEILPNLIGVAGEVNMQTMEQEAVNARRNENWLKEIPSILTQGPYLIAVGALHLPGEKGLVNSLTDMGYELTDLLPWNNPMNN